MASAVHRPDGGRLCHHGGAPDGLITYDHAEARVHLSAPRALVLPGLLATCAQLGLPSARLAKQRLHP